MVKRNKCYRPQLVIPQTFEQCFTYEEQILYLKQLIEENEDADLTEIEQRLSAVEASVANLNNEVAEINVDEINAQLQSINAELTELKNKSSTQADSITALQTAVAGKQNTLTFDNAPTAGSTNPVTSDGIRKALAGKQNTLTFDNTPTAGSNNPVTSDGIRTAIDEAGGGGGTSRVEWVETNVDEFIASLPANVTYTTDVITNDINTNETSLIPNDFITGTFTRTGMFISSDKRYLKIVFDVTQPKYGSTPHDNVSHSVDIHDPMCQFTYSAFYLTLTGEGYFMFTNTLYGISRNYDKVLSTGRCGQYGGLDPTESHTCTVYFKLIPELPIDLM